MFLQDFWLNNDEIDRVRSTDIKKSLHLKKLYLVLDLDHTLLNSTHLNHMTAEEEYLHSQTDSLQGIQCFPFMCFCFCNTINAYTFLCGVFLVPVGLCKL